MQPHNATLMKLMARLARTMSTEQILRFAGLSEEDVARLDVIAVRLGVSRRQALLMAISSGLGHARVGAEEPSVRARGASTRRPTPIAKRRVFLGWRR
jgi:hypothetical protein